ncbi:MAG: phage head closure protein [Oscillospiraceae bacterium]|nr:phage head closure protein [Oscillospiraceae bacterium]
MKISLLNERITFEKNTTVVDENANHKNVWQEYFSCYTYAGSSSYQQKEQQVAGITVTENGLVFTVRYCSELSHLDSTHFRVRFKDETYNITSVDMMNYKKESIKVSCEKERRNS